MLGMHKYDGFLIVLVWDAFVLFLCRRGGRILLKVILRTVLEDYMHRYRGYVLLPCSWSQTLLYYCKRLLPVVAQRPSVLPFLSRTHSRILCRIFFFE